MKLGKRSFNFVNIKASQSYVLYKVPDILTNLQKKQTNSGIILSLNMQCEAWTETFLKMWTETKRSLNCGMLNKSPHTTGK